jgi:hypothetical protein
MEAIRLNVVGGSTLQTDTRTSQGVAQLRRWLAGRTASERATLARLWALPDGTHDDPAALADAMTDAQAVERVLASLGSRERAALTLVQQHGGRIAAPLLEREFGALRELGDYPNPRAYLLALEQPPSPTERLWALGLIASADEATPPNGRARSYLIPPALAALLPPAPERNRALHIVLAADPASVAPGATDAVGRSLLTLLALGQDGLLEVIPSGGLNKASLKRIAQEWEPGEKLSGISREEHWPYVQFVRRVGEGAGLLRVGADARLRPTREALEWLRMSSVERSRRLLDGWVESAWDELASFLGIKVQRPYFRDLPAAKRALLGLIGQAPAGEWIDLDDFVAEIKRVEPDFARPDGRYDGWGLVGYARQSLDGFAAWEQVEGEQIAWIAGTTLRWLGLTDLGVEEKQAVSFRITPLGATLLAGAEPPAEPPAEPLVVQPNFEVVVTPHGAPYARFQLGRIAERARPSTAGKTAAKSDALIYRLTRRSVQIALEHGIALDDIMRFLEEQAGHPPPQNVVASLRDWAGQHGRVSLRRAVLLEADDAALLEQIRHDRRVRAPQVERLTDTAWLVREGDAPELAERLRKAGYGLAGDADEPNAPLREHDMTVLFAALEFYTQACASLGIEGDASVAMRTRVAKLLPEKQLNRAYQASHAALQRLKERLKE